LDIESYGPVHDSIKFRAVTHLTHSEGKHLQVKIGVYTGPASAGLVGLSKPRYCYFGPTVKGAQLLQEKVSTSRYIAVSSSTYKRLVHTESDDEHGVPKRLTGWIPGPEVRLGPSRIQSYLLPTNPNVMYKEHTLRAPGPCLSAPREKEEDLRVTALQGEIRTLKRQLAEAQAANAASAASQQGRGAHQQKRMAEQDNDHSGSRSFRQFPTSRLEIPRVATPTPTPLSSTIDQDIAREKKALMRDASYAASRITRQALAQMRGLRSGFFSGQLEAVRVNSNPGNTLIGSRSSPSPGHSQGDRRAAHHHHNFKHRASRAWVQRPRPHSSYAYRDQSGSGGLHTSHTPIVRRRQIERLERPRSFA